MSNSNRVIIHQLFSAEKMEVRHFGNLLHRVPSELQTSVTFFLLVNENLKCG